MDPVQALAVLVVVLRVFAAQVKDDLADPVFGVIFPQSVDGLGDYLETVGLAGTRHTEVSSAPLHDVGGVDTELGFDGVIPLSSGEAGHANLSIVAVDGNVVATVLVVDESGPASSDPASKPSAH